MRSMASSTSRANRIQVHGIDGRFTGLFSPVSGTADAGADAGANAGANADAEGGLSLGKAPGQVFPAIAINAALQRELGAKVGDPILLSFPRPSDIHRESVFASRSSHDVVELKPIDVY